MINAVSLNNDITKESHWLNTTLPKVILITSMYNIHMSKKINSFETNVIISTP